MPVGTQHAAWYVAASVGRANADRIDSERYHALGSQKNWSGGLLIGAVVFGIGEAVIYGATHPIDPDADFGPRFGPMP